jgi:hypothetical protein
MLSAFPNPFSGTTTIRLSQLATRNPQLTLRVYDASGRLVQSPCVISTSSFRIDLRSMPAGVYFARLTNPNRTATLKLILQR